MGTLHCYIVSTPQYPFLSSHIMPMVDYIDWKQSSGVEFLPTELQRKEVTLPDALEVSKADISCLSDGCPRFVPFLSKYVAQQMKEKNIQKAHIKHEFARQSKNPETIPQKRTCIMIRDQYIAGVDSMHKAKLQKIKNIEKEEKKKEFDANNKHGYLKYIYNVHAK